MTESVVTANRPFEIAFTAIGKIIATFARIESGLYVLYRGYTGLDDAAARAVIGEPRFSDVSAAIKRLANVRSMDPLVLAGLNEAISRISQVKRFRDLFAHRAFHLSEVDGAFSDVVFEEHGFSKNPNANFFVTYTLEELAVIGAECNRLHLLVDHLDGVINEDLHPFHLEQPSALQQMRNMPTFPDHRRTQSQLAQPPSSPSKGR